MRLNHLAMAALDQLRGLFSLTPFMTVSYRYLVLFREGSVSMDSEHVIDPPH